MRLMAVSVGAVLALTVFGLASGTATRSALLAVFVVAMLGISWDVLSRAGLVSVGQGAVFGLAAYVTAILTAAHVPYAVAIVLSIASAALASMLFGLITLRLQGIYFSLTTLAVGVAAQAAILMAPGITRGAAGISLPQIAGGDLFWQVVVLGGALLAAAVASDLALRSRFGTVLFAIRDAPHVARASGIDITRWRTAAFVLSAAIAALAGGVYAGLFGYIHSDDVLALQWSVQAIAAAVIGGTDLTIGSIVGAAVIVLINTYLSGTVGGGIGQLAYGTMLIVLLLFARGGLSGIAVQLFLRVRRPRTA